MRLWPLGLILLFERPVKVGDHEYAVVGVHVTAHGNDAAVMRHTLDSPTREVAKIVVRRQPEFVLEP